MSRPDVVTMAELEQRHDPWPEPKPVSAELKPIPAFDPEALLPEFLRAWVMDEADRMPCPPEFVAAAVMVALSAIVGARCAIKPKARDSWTIVPNLWGGIVGDPSAKKSPAWGVALRPLDRLIAKALDQHRAKWTTTKRQRWFSRRRKNPSRSASKPPRTTRTRAILR